MTAVCSSGAHVYWIFISDPLILLLFQLLLLFLPLIFLLLLFVFHCLIVFDNVIQLGSIFLTAAAGYDHYTNTSLLSYYVINLLLTF